MNTCVRVLGVAAVLALLGTVVAVQAAPAKDGDPLLKDTVWKGKLTQKGGGPELYECEFKITKRDGDKFEADLYEKTEFLELTYLVRGTITPVDPKNKEKGYKIEFESYDAKDVKNTTAIIKVPYKATLTGKKITGTWKLPEDSEFGQLEGDFEFEMAKKDD